MTCGSATSSAFLPSFSFFVCQQGVDTSTAYFSPFTQTAIDALLAEGTVLKCAGGIMIEHELLQPFIRGIEGSIDGIQGLPKQLTARLINDAALA